MMMAFILSISVMEWMRDGWISTPHAILTLTANMHRSRGVASAYILYIALGICSTLIALYTANLTSAVLQEKV
jgi:hypothetical protein